jgi:hypothetical protein
MARIVDRDAFEGLFAGGGLVQVEQHPPGLALAAPEVRQAGEKELFGRLGLAVRVQDRRFFDHRGAGRRGRQVGQVFRAEQAVGVQFDFGFAGRLGRDGRHRRRGTARAAPGFIVEDVGGHLELDLVDLGRSGARDLALAFALGLGVERHARAGVAEQGGRAGGVIGARAGGRLRRRRIGLFLQEGKQPHRRSFCRFSPVETVARRRARGGAHA